MSEKSIAHRGGMNWAGQSRFADGLVDWSPERAPDLSSGDTRRTTGRLRSCGYCGSMHPADLAAALKAGATASWADFKYGWPHKLYVEGIANPHAGMLESRVGASHATPMCPKTGALCEHGKQSFGRTAKCECMQRGEPTQGDLNGQRMVRMQQGFRSDSGEPNYGWHGAGEPASQTTWGKFYTVHLQDASADDRKVIERAMGLQFTFHEGDKVSWAKFSEGA